jgi:UDP-2,4-diacetamido-2,4,6-trideoxy-beta-L-altropyranose hydrolase
LNQVCSIGFRVDSGKGVGEGHLSRCLGIANQLKKYNFKIYFYSMSLLNNSNYLITENQFFLEEIPVNKKNNNEMKRLDFLNNQIDSFKKLDAIILDSYQICKTEEKFVKSIIPKVIVIDDLINRNFVCDIIINYNFGITSNDYDCLYDNKITRLLIGPSFTPLKLNHDRPIFMNKKKGSEKKTILVSVGGLDESNYILFILECLVLSKLKNIQLIILMSKKAPHILLVKKFLKRNFLFYKLIIGERYLYKIMLSADFAIGGIGVTALERVAMALPTIMFSAAENQDTYLNLFNKIPGISTIVSPVRNKKYKLVFLIKFYYRNIQSLKKKSFYAKRYFNGHGASKITEEIIKMIKGS